MENALRGKRIGVAMTGSFCTFAAAFAEIERLKERQCELYPIMSYHAYALDTRFFRAEEARERLAEICGRPVWHSIPEVEPIGPKKLLDLLLVMPCTGNTLAKLACGISDTPVTMACKSQLRNERPVVLCVSTNDGLSGNARNIGELLTRRHCYFLPYGQDDSRGKPHSLLFAGGILAETCEKALAGVQMQPILWAKNI